MFNHVVKYSYDDVTVLPAVKSYIKHRSECNPRTLNGNLPIFAAPMSTVVDKKNYELFKKNGIIPILPRTVENTLDERIDYAISSNWAAFSLNEFKALFTVEGVNLSEKQPCKVLIDIANGHMAEMFDAVRIAKELYGKAIIVMVGNVANPETYKECYRAHVDYIRMSIGTGFGCITSTQTAIHYPIASLINETYQIKAKNTHIDMVNGDENAYINAPKIVADGGIRGYGDVIKALALGADYVMIGSEFAKLIESAADIYFLDNVGNKCLLDLDKFNISEDNGRYFYHEPLSENGMNIEHTLYKSYYGMASKQGQIDMTGEKSKTAEGTSKQIKVTTNINKWVENMDSYLRSAMSYLNIKSICDLKPTFVDTCLMSSNAKSSINK